MLCSSFFFFKQKTAYEMRISDWSSDVSSSDLALRHTTGPQSRLVAALFRRAPHSGRLLADPGHFLFRAAHHIGIRTYPQMGGLGDGTLSGVVMFRGGVELADHATQPRRNGARSGGISTELTIRRAVGGACSCNRKIVFSKISHRL